jgi:hypothetical protein
MVHLGDRAHSVEGIDKSKGKILTSYDDARRTVSRPDCASSSSLKLLAVRWAAARAVRSAEVSDAFTELTWAITDAAEEMRTRVRQRKANAESKASTA